MVTIILTKYIEHIFVLFSLIKYQKSLFITNQSIYVNPENASMTLLTAVQGGFLDLIHFNDRNQNKKLTHSHIIFIIHIKLCISLFVMFPVPPPHLITPS